jgi:hypothetical protein
LNQLARSQLTIIITEIFVKKGGAVTIDTAKKKQDEIATLPAPDEEGVESSVPPIPLQSDIRRMATLACEAADSDYESITLNTNPIKTPTSAQQ